MEGTGPLALHTGATGWQDLATPGWRSAGAGQTPLKLELDICRKLRSYISEPEVTVMVEQINSQKFNILGQVAKPGSYPLTNSATVLDAMVR